MVMLKECKQQTVPIEIATATMEGTRKRVRPCQRKGDEGEEVLNIVGIKYRQAIARDRREMGKVFLEGKAHNGLQRLRRKRRRMIVCRERSQQDATNPMFIIKFVSQHVSGIIMPIIRRTRPCTTAYGVLYWLCWLWLNSNLHTVHTAHDAAPHNHSQPHNVHCTQLMTQLHTTTANHIMCTARSSRRSSTQPQPTA